MDMFEGYSQKHCVSCGQPDIVKDSDWTVVRYRCPECFITVEITELARVNSGEEDTVVTVKDPRDLKWEWEERIFELVQDFQQTITQGSAIACPVWER